MDRESKQATHQSARRQRLKVLVVEDNSICARVIQVMLTVLGHQPYLVSEARSALEVWSTSSFDCVLMDLALPDMNGAQIMKMMREKGSGNGTDCPIVAMTAHAYYGDRTRFLADGFDGYIAKPLRMADMAHEIERVCHSACFTGTHNEQ
ncbi:MAG: response regulator [Geobacter sp.]|nr:response regulator [Geobacter sp.]